jgi:hypothetical protein
MIEAQVVAAFRKIIKALGDDFLENEVGPTQVLLHKIHEQIEKHPNSRVAIAFELAGKYYNNCNENNDDLLLDMRSEMLNHEKLWAVFKFWTWFKHITVNKDQETEKSFYSAEAFQNHLMFASPQEKRTIAADMRAEANNLESKTRSATLVRGLRP